MCTILASFANNNTWDEIHDFVVDNYRWIKSFLQMTGGIPTKNSYERIIGLINKDELNSILLDFFKTITFELNPQTKLINFDGRSNNGSKRNSTFLNDAKKALNCLNVYSNQYGYCIVTEMINDKTNEIPTIEEIIKTMNLTGTISTWDALNSQTKNVKAVIEAGGDYTVPIKGNQATFLQDLIDYFDVKRREEIIAGNLQSEYLTYIEESHSSIIKYELFQTSDINWYSKLEDWRGLKTFGLVRKTITKKVLVENKRKKRKKKENRKTCYYS